MVVVGLTEIESMLVILLQASFAFDSNGVARGIFPHKNVLGGRMVLLLLCCLLLFVQGWRRLTTLAFAALGIVLLCFTHSRTSFAMTPVPCVLPPFLLPSAAPPPLPLFPYLPAFSPSPI